MTMSRYFPERPRKTFARFLGNQYGVGCHVPKQVDT